MRLTTLTLLTIISSSFSSLACSPCSSLEDVTSTLVGTNLELTFTSNAGWECCYTVQIEIICDNAAFTGVANYFSAEICINGGSAPSTTTTTLVPYPLTVIDVSGFCPGTYKWRAEETGCGIYTPEFTFTVAGASPINLLVNQTETEICLNDNSQFSATASGGCNLTGYIYSWSPTAGLSDPNIANPIASPTTTTTYTLTVSEIGACTAPQTADLTLTVNPLPNGSILGDAALCEGDPVPTLTLSGSGSTSPYTIDYSLNGVPQTSVVTAGTSTTIVGPNSPPGTYIYEITNVTDASTTLCSQVTSSIATVIVNGNPIVSAGADVELCEPNGGIATEVTLNGSGATTYVWDNSVTDGISFVPPAAQITIYTVTGTDANGCIGTDQVAVSSYPLPTALGSATPIYGNAPLVVDFTNLSVNAATYAWNFGDLNTANTAGLTDVSNEYLSSGIYTVSLLASNGICFDIWEINIEVLPPMIVTPPNIFSPNEDGSNDLYFVNVEYGEQFEALIINRWGNVMGTLDSINQGWDGNTPNGTQAEEGVYFVKYTATDFNGNPISGHANFTLIR